MGLYPKVYRTDNMKDGKWDIYKLNRKESILIQEKLDGSQFSIGLHNGEFGIWSKNRSLMKEKEFQKTNLEYLQTEEFKDKFLKSISDLGEEFMPAKTFLVSGEILGSGRLAYNKDKELSGDFFKGFYIFDIQVSFYEGNLDSDVRPIVDNLGWDSIEEFAKLLGVNTVPLIDKITLDEYLEKEQDIIEEYVQDKDGKAYISLLDNKTPREGIVVKVYGTDLKYKVVSESFKERSNVKYKEKQAPIDDVIIGMFVTDGRISKHIQKWIEEGIITEEYKEDKKQFKQIVENAHTIIDDVFEEEIDEILAILKKRIVRKVNSKVIQHALQPKIPN